MLVIASVIGWKKTSAYVVLTVVMATFRSSHAGAASAATTGLGASTHLR